MPRYKLLIEYHGGPFVGWQRQDNGASAQGAIEAALAMIGEPRRSESATEEEGAARDAPDFGAVYGAGRTDAGVHALGQAAHVDLRRDWDPFRLSEALNHHLKPAPIAVRAASRARADFHARFDAIERRYLYRLAARRAPLALEHGLLWRRPGPLDVEAMRAAAASLVGRHDFTTFRAAQCQAASPVKTLDALEVEAVAAPIGAEWEGEIRVAARARSFLHNQVRSLVGTLERVGAGAWPPERVRAALEARDRAACGPVAPPDGLYLVEVRYPPEDAG